MNQPKPLLPVPPDSIPLVRHQVERISRGMDIRQTIVVANDPAVAAVLEDRARVRVVPDRIQGQGPLQGLVTGLELAGPWSIALACDMPLARPTLLQWLLQRARAHDPGGPWQAVIPVVQGQAQPLLAVYHASCLPSMRAALDRGLRHMSSFWADLHLLKVPQTALQQVDPQAESFFNVNTPADWRIYLDRVSGLD